MGAWVCARSFSCIWHKQFSMLKWAYIFHALSLLRKLCFVSRLTSRCYSLYFPTEICCIFACHIHIFVFLYVGTDIYFITQQILHAVYTIHEERIVHSDLKPANFLLVKGSMKLIDFGIAKAIMSDTTNIQRDAQVFIVL